MTQELSSTGAYTIELENANYRYLRPYALYASNRWTALFAEMTVITNDISDEWTTDENYHWHINLSTGAEATETAPQTCTVCGYVIKAALGHTHDVDTTKYESDETNHWNTCSGCSEKQNISAHDFEWKIDKDATATEKGSKHEECVVCGYARPAVEIPATGSAPETGDNRNMFLWIALLSVSGFGIVTTAVYGKKRKSVK